MTGLRALVEAVAVNRAARGCGGCEACQACADVRWSQYRLANAITPDVLAAVEAIVALGEARAVVAAEHLRINMPARLDANSNLRIARQTIDELADRLAARRGE